jgi:chromosome partitioning protein
MAGSFEAGQAIVETGWPNLFVLPASPDLSAVEGELSSSIDKELVLRDALRRDGTRATFDYVLFDTPPSFGFHTISALAAAGEVLIPVQMSGFAIRGLKEVLRTVHLVRSRLNPELAILGIVPTFVNLRTKFSRQLLDGLCELANIRVFATVITPTVKLQETSLAGVPITAYASSSKAAAAYRELAGEVMTEDAVAASV